MGKLSPPAVLEADVKRGPGKKQPRGNHSCEAAFATASAGMAQGVLSGGAHPSCFWEVSY